jgi:ATP-dependent Zn protease
MCFGFLYYFWLVFCFQTDRLSILSALSTKLPLMAGISKSDLEVIAQRTLGFTGADLQALLYTAQLHGIQGKVLN